MPRLRLTDVTVRDDTSTGRPRLDRVSLAVNGGEIVALVGASGAGKTTLLDVAAGLRRADGGTVETPGTGTDPGADSDVDDDAVHVGIAFQSPERMFLAPTLEAEVSFAVALALAGR